VAVYFYKNPQRFAGKAEKQSETIDNTSSFS
jgi:hypothetical protein